MEKRNLICICCPLGCSLTVTLLEGKNSIVEGNTCPKGKSYGEKECINPTRMVTSSVPVLGGASPMVSVKTRTDIPKEKIMECMAALKEAAVKAPVEIGDTIIKNAADTGVDIVATKKIPCR